MYFMTEHTFDSVNVNLDMYTRARTRAGGEVGASGGHTVP